jgi:hypothetical protein
LPKTSRPRGWRDGLIDQEIDLETVNLEGKQLEQMLGWIRYPGTHGYGTPQGYALYYLLTLGMPLPPTGELMIASLYDGIDAGSLDHAWEAYRGATKSTVANNWISYQLGLRPWAECMVIRIMDPAAAESTDFISKTIEYNAGFHAAFPHVVPDKNRGWGADGYWIMRDDMDYPDWLRLTTDTPSLLGAGYKSGIIIGKHPRGVLLIDDIHNSRNTRSARELNQVLEIYGKDIRNIRTPATLQLMAFTPWVFGDLYETYQKKPGVTSTTIKITKEGTWPGTPTWPEEHPENVIQDYYDDPTVGPINFALMYLCDRTAKKGAVLPGDWISGFPASELDPTWKTVFGVDYASIQDHQNTRGRDEFSIAAGKVHPVSGTIILFDGFHGHQTQGEAEQTTVAMLEKYKNSFLRCGIENVGKGEAFYNIMLTRYARGIRGQGVRNQPKGLRIEKQLAPAFMDGRIMIATDDGVDGKVKCNFDYIDWFVTSWLMYDGSGAFNDDTLDAVYHMGLAAKGFLRMRPEESETIYTDDKVEKRKNPVLAFMGK